MALDKRGNVGFADAFGTAMARPGIRSNPSLVRIGNGSIVQKTGMERGLEFLVYDGATEEYFATAPLSADVPEYGRH